MLDEQDPRDQNGNVLYDSGGTLLDTWRQWKVSLTATGAGPLPSGFNVKRILGKGDLWITEYTIPYQGANNIHS
ncbi:hypothetical protein [Tunturiibacter gelidiferens]|uniref:hypothetical protein n=1 Tax=Tunturiibacter gelidiferens TaxID=3069689 RepID=UPI003D9ABFE5